jgi:RsiW-degrading membrane proteinase PrsW (M82 family)
MNFIKKVIKKRWHLHIIGGAIAGLLIFALFCLLGFYSSTRWWEETVLQLVFGTVIGLGFEIVQDHTSAVYYQKLEILYKLQIFSRK